MEGITSTSQTAAPPVIAEYLNEHQVAHMTGFSLSKLRNDRYLSRGLPYIKEGKSIRYEYADIRAYMTARKIRFDA